MIFCLSLIMLSSILRLTYYLISHGLISSIIDLLITYLSSFDVLWVKNIAWWFTLRILRLFGWFVFLNKTSLFFNPILLSQILWIHIENFSIIFSYQKNQAADCIINGNRNINEYMQENECTEYPSVHENLFLSLNPVCEGNHKKWATNHNILIEQFKAIFKFIKCWFVIALVNENEQIHK